MADKSVLGAAAHKNIEALCEIRNSSVHFYNKSTIFAIRLQEICSASVKNFVRASQIWFDNDLSQYNFYLMPLAFFKLSSEISPVLLNKEEKNLASYISSLEAANDPYADYAVSVNIELKFSKSKAGDALQVQLKNDPNAHKLQLAKDQ